MSKTIFLERLTLKNFKGIKELTVNFSKLTNIYGDNATGKTTIFDAFIWLLFDKDSQNKSKFDVQPLDKNNNVEKMVETEVTAVLRINNNPVTLRKILRQKWVKKRGEVDSKLKGTETEYFIDDVPKKQNEYRKAVNEIIQEDIFKLLTNPIYFSTSMKWQDRKNVLMEMIGHITDENVIDSKKALEPLKDLLGNKSIEELKSSINASRKKLIKDKESIPPRVDELKRTIRNDIDFSSLEVKRLEIVSEIHNLEDQLIDSSKINDELLMKKDNLYDLKSKLKSIEYLEIQKSESGKKKMFEDVYGINSEISRTKFDIQSLEADKENKVNSVKELEATVKNLRSRWHEENNKLFELPENARICPLCKRPFSDEDIEIHRMELQQNFKQNKAEKLKSISKEGVSKANELKKYEVRLSGNEAALKSANTELENLNNKAAVLQSKIDNFKVVVDLDGNKEYQDLLKQIKELEAQLSKPVEEGSKIKEIKERKVSLESQLQQVNHDLGYKEINDKTATRIEELQDKEKVLAQQIADIEKQENLCNEFVKTKVKLLESSINSKFKYVKFRFFKVQVNGGMEDDCEALIDGIPFNTNLNNAARVNAGIDIINALCEHYEINAPIFIDNKESITRLINSNGQIVNLIVSSKDKKLRVETSDMSEETELAG